MSSYSRISKERLATCHSDLRVIFNAVIKRVDHSIFCGHRGESNQNKAFDDGLSKVKYPDSRHNVFPSMAVDAGPYFVDLKNTDWDDYKAFAFFAGYVKCIADDLLAQGKITHTVRWGGDWDGDGRTSDQTFHDLPHFELVRA